MNDKLELRFPAPANYVDELMIRNFVVKFLGSVVLLLLAIVVSGQKPQRFVAVTIDDLPVVVKNSSLKKRQKITRKLLKHVNKARVPAIGFVNENKLYRGSKLVDAEVNLLRKWLDAGLELGNHSYSHKSLHKISLEEYQSDILKGEIVTKRLLAEKGMRMRYFRHPFLNTGLEMQIKKDLDAFLNKHEYTIAPVSIDNSDWAFSRAYDNAIEKNDRKLKKRIGMAYVPYLEEKTDYWERQSVKLLQREIKQTLLLHANSINADYFDDVAKMYKKRGYKFISLEEALKDDAYRMPDTFIRRSGISWLHRWALAEGKRKLVSNEPRVPKFVMKAAGLTSE